MSLINNAEEIKHALNAGTYILDEEDNNVVQKLKGLANQFYGIQDYDKKYLEFYQRLNSLFALP